MKVKESFTGQYLKPVLARSAASGLHAGGVSKAANKKRGGAGANKKSGYPPHRNPSADQD